MPSQRQTLLDETAQSLSASDLPTTASILRIGKVSFQPLPECPTARMTFDPKSGKATIELDPSFVDQYAYTPLRLAALISHELLHHLLHHHVLYPEGHLPNLSQDVLINALICRLSPSFQQLFNDHYAKNEFPAMFLRPGANLKRIEPEEIRLQVQSIYRLLYRKASRWELRDYASGKAEDVDVVSVDDILAVLTMTAATQERLQEANVQAGREKMEGLGGLQEDWWKGAQPLLGNHEPQVPAPLSEEAAEDFAHMLEDLTRDLSSNANAAGLFKRSFKISLSQAPDALLSAMEAAMRQDILRTQTIVDTIVGRRPNLRSVIPAHLSRKEVFLLSQGVIPLFYPSFGPHTQPRSEVTIYIDVSGSMGDQAPFLLMLLTAFRNQVATEFFQFSTEIAPTNFADFVKTFESTGEVFMQSTGGTAFDPIFLHAREQGFPKVLLITDGCAQLGDEAAAIAADLETYTVFTLGHQPEPLLGVARQTWVMPELQTPLRS